MNGFDLSGFAAALPYTAGAIIVVLAATFAAAKIVHHHNVIDVAWCLLFAAVAGGACALAPADSARRGALLVVPLAWGLRLATHIGRRSRGNGEDPRYDKLLS